MGDRRLTATVLFQLGFANTATNDFLTARTYLADALRLAKLLDSTLLEASIGVALAQNEYLAGDPAAALRLIDEVLANDPSRNSAETGIAWALADKSTYLIALGRYDEARTNAKETLECALGLQANIRDRTVAAASCRGNPPASGRRPRACGVCGRRSTLRLRRSYLFVMISKVVQYPAPAFRAADTYLYGLAHQRRAII